MRNTKFYNIFLKNLHLKALSVILATTVWGIIQSEQILEINREISVALEVPEGYIVRGETSLSLGATLKGPRVLVMEAPKQLETTIKIPPASGKYYRVRVDSQDIKKLNPRLNLTIHNPYFSVFIDKKATRSVPIRYVPIGTPADGYFVKKVDLNPDQVEIVGLKTDVMKIRGLVTEPIDINGLSQNRTIEVGLIPPSGILAKNLSATTTQVTLEVGDSFINQRFGSIPIEIVGSEFTATIKPRFASIVIQGTPGVLKFVNKSDLKAFVEVAELSPGRYEKDIKVRIPSETVLIESFPTKATVTLEAEQKEGSL